MLTTGKMNEILIEVGLGKSPPSHESEEEKEFRRKMVEAEKDAAKKGWELTPVFDP